MTDRDLRLLFLVDEARHELADAIGMLDVGGGEGVHDCCAEAHGLLGDFRTLLLSGEEAAP